jgi:heat-inducible transcriptional repressor
MSVNLNPRHQEILRAAIRHYIATAEPVGSQALVDEYNLKVSSATIRSCFAHLEKVGLLYQPHTSAGRVPSDSGYRLYVDRLIEPAPALGKQLERLFNDRIDWQGWSLEAMLRGASQILATLSGYISLITLPQTRHAIVRHLQFVKVEARRVMLIVVLDSYETKSVLMDLTEGEADDKIDRQLEILANFLNSKLQGKSLLELANLDWSELDRELHFYADTISNLIAEVHRRDRTHYSTEIMVRGVAEVLGQPEFCELEQVRTLLHLLEYEQDRILPLFGDLISTEDRDRSPQITIRIGAENPLEPMQTCTLISATYHQDYLPIGSVGLLGPKRMLYEDAIALVSAAAECISEAIAQK